MSDFFEPKYQRPLFAPVIKITGSKNKPVFISDIAQDGHMDLFGLGEEVKKTMKYHGLTLMETAKKLGIDPVTAAGRLRLLEFNDAEKDAVREYGYTEREALCFLQLPVKTRLYAMAFCRQENYDTHRIEQYIQQTLAQSRNVSKSTFELKDIGFVENSIKKTLELAQKMGIETSIKISGTENSRSFLINVNRKKEREDNEK